MSSEVLWLDPSLENVNAGDEIIADAVWAHVDGASTFQRITTHRRLTVTELRTVRAAHIAMVGGTNIINSRLLIDRQWPMPPWQITALWGKLVFVGSGWWQYQHAPDPVTTRIFRGLSHPDISHAVRDNYTANRLSDMGVDVIMTGCPTMWSIDGVTTRVAPGQDKVATTLTDYYLDVEADRAWMVELSKHYGEVQVVGMGPGDKEAFGRLGTIPGVRWAGFGTDGLQQARVETSDLIGTRLHAAVRWLQLGGSALVLSVDNRATEIGKDTGLPTLTRGDLSALQEHLQTQREDRIRMPADAIAEWKARWREVRDAGHA